MQYAPEVHKDEIYTVVLQATAEEEEGEEPFVHSIASWPA